MKKLLLISACLMTSIVGFSQITFERHYYTGGGGCTGGVLQTDDGGYIIAAEEWAGGSALIIKTDEYGDTVWTKTYSEYGFERPHCIQKTKDNGYILVGTCYGLNPGGYSIMLVKIDANGELLWQKIFGGSYDDDGYYVTQTSDSGYAIAGVTLSFGPGSSSVYFIKTDINGDTLWTRIYNKMIANYAFGFVELTNGGYVIVGATFDFSQTIRDVYLIRIDSGGDTLWTRTIGGNNIDDAYSIKSTSDGGYVIIGTTESYGPSGKNIYLVKTDSSGNVQWSTPYGGADIDEGYRVTICSDGGFAFCGTTGDFSQDNRNSILLKTDANGDTLWTRTFVNPGNDWFSSIQETTDGGFILAGYIEIGGYYEAYLVKTDAYGHVAGMNDYPLSANKAIDISPNPTTGHISLQLSTQFGWAEKIEIYDHTGRFLLSMDFSAEVDVTSLSGGLYYLVVTNEEGARVTGRFIRE